MQGNDQLRESVAVFDLCQLGCATFDVLQGNRRLFIDGKAILVCSDSYSVVK